jgi:hypothetical protein
MVLRLDKHHLMAAFVTGIYLGLNAAGLYQVRPNAKLELRGVLAPANGQNEAAVIHK